MFYHCFTEMSIGCPLFTDLDSLQPLQSSAIHQPGSLLSRDEGVQVRETVLCRLGESLGRILSSLTGLLCRMD